MFSRDIPSRLEDRQWKYRQENVSESFFNFSKLVIWLKELYEELYGA